MPLRVPTVSRVLYGALPSPRCASITTTGIATPAMQTNRVQLAYAAPSQFTNTELWHQIKTSVEAQFPLRTLHWKSGTRTSIRTIQTLEVDLVPFEGIKEEGVSQIPLSLLDKPFLNVFIVACAVRGYTLFPYEILTTEF